MGLGRLTLVIPDPHNRITLWDFARLLQRAPVGLTHAMSMDGGYEAELCVSAAPFYYASFGRWKGGPDASDAPGAKVPLPAVIAVMLE